MKKYYFFGFLSILLMGTGVSQAQDYPEFPEVVVNGITYLLDTNAHTASVTTPYDSPSTFYSGNITIPSSIIHDTSSYTVTAVADMAFFNCSNLYYVQLPNTITSIGYGAFASSISASVSLPSSVTYIGDYAFATSLWPQSYCYNNNYVSVDVLNITGNMYIGSYAFSGSCIYNVYLNSSAPVVSTFPFYGCDIFNLYIGDITTIPNYAFYQARFSSYTSINIPSSVTHIGSYAFAAEYEYDLNTNMNSGSATMVFIPASVSSIDTMAFSGRSCNITSLSTNPSAWTYVIYDDPLSYGVYDDLDTNMRNIYRINVNVPCGSQHIYDSLWSVKCINNIPSNTDSVYLYFTGRAPRVRVLTANATMGSASVTSVPTCSNLEAVVTATANEGYIFDHWSNGSTNNPYTFSVTSDTSLTAYFVQCVTIHDTITIYDTIIIDNYIYDTSYVHDTTIVTQYDTTIVNNYIHDTTYITLHDTITNTIHDTINIIVHDTVTNTVHDTIDNYVYDTMWVHDTTIVTDTLWLTDTVFLYDTVIVYDTVYITGVENAEPLDAKIYARDGQIVVEGANGYTVTLYDAVGRHLATRETLPGGEPCELGVAATGVYLVKVGPYPARRIVVKR